MKSPDIAIQIKTIVSSFVLACLGAGLVVCVGLMARPSLSDIPYAAASGPSVGVVKAIPSSSWADRNDIRLR